MKTTIYLATAEGLVVITNAGEGWQAKRCLEGMQLQSVAVAHSPSPVIHCGSFGQGVLSSKDRGETWAQSPSLSTTRVTALATTETGTVYAGTEPSALYRSDDEGKTWTKLAPLVDLPSASLWSFPPRPETHHVQAILLNPAKPNSLQVAIEAGALVSSEDGGATWQDRVGNGPLDSHTLATDPSDAERIYSAAGDGFFESSSGGKTWQTSQVGLHHRYCWSVAVAPNPSEVMLLSASQHAYTAHTQQIAQSFIYRRVGRGSWHLSMDGLATLPQARIPVIAAGTLEPNTFFLSTDGVIYRSQDLGRTWKELRLEWTSREPARRHSLSMAVLQEEV
jgi:photosystem II stability/assembly factor-like uncharacterized protein